MINKKSELLIFVMLLTLFIVTGCGSSPRIQIVEGKINVMTSIYPLYDFALKIGGEHVHVINLVPAGVDPHDWAPKPRDMAAIINADVFIYNGLGFEGWTDSFISGLEKEDKLITIVASKGIAAISTDHDQSDHADHDHGGFDPHVWLSPLQAVKLAENIKDGLVQVDPANRVSYEANFEWLIEQLNELHQKYEEVISNSPSRNLVVSHEAYGYLARDYGLNQVGVLGLSSHAEPTVRTMMSIIDFINENNINYILFEQLASPRIAQTLADDTGISILKFNTLEGLTADQLAAGEDYISVMYENLTSLEKALE